MLLNGRIRADLVLSWLFATALLLFVGAIASQWLGARPGTTGVTEGREVPQHAPLPVRQVSVSEGGEALLVAHGQAYHPLEYCLYDLETLHTIRVIPADGGAWKADAACVSRAVLCGPGDDVVLAAGQRDGTVVVLRNEQWTVHQLHEEPVLAVACARGGRIAASADGLLRVWNTDSGQILKTIESPETIRDLAFSADTVHLVATTRDDEFMVWDWANGRLLLSCHAPNLLTLAISPDGRHLLTGHIYGDVRLWSASTGSELWRTAKRDPDAILALRFLPDGRSFVCVTAAGTIEAWSSDGTLTSSAILPVRLSGEASLAIAGNGQRLFIGSLDGVVDIWDVSTLQVCGQLVRRTGHGS